MLHVLPAGTYGLRPAVNRSNTRTRCGRTPSMCIGVVVCTAVPVVYRIPSPSVLHHPYILPLVAIHPSLHLVSQELHHQVITSTSRTPPPSVVLPASHPDAFTGPRSFPKPSAACHPRIIAKPSFPKESRD